MPSPTATVLSATEMERVESTSGRGRCRSSRQPCMSNLRRTWRHRAMQQTAVVLNCSEAASACSFGSRFHDVRAPERSAPFAPRHCVIRCRLHSPAELSKCKKTSWSLNRCLTTVPLLQQVFTRRMCGASPANGVIRVLPLSRSSCAAFPQLHSASHSVPLPLYCSSLLQLLPIPLQLFLPHVWRRWQCSLTMAG